MIASQSASSVSSSPFECGPATIALFTITSIRPVCCTAARTSLSMSSQRAASAWMSSALPPCSAIRSVVVRPPSRGVSRTSPITTCAPSRAKARAMARPIPEDPPVMTADFPVSLALS